MWTWFACGLGSTKAKLDRDGRDERIDQVTHSKGLIKLKSKHEWIN